MPREQVGDTATLWTAAHPPRKDSEEYLRTRAWLMGKTAGGCYVCGGATDMTHPQGPGDPHGMQDHHGGGIFIVVEGTPVLIGFTLFPLEWSEGWGADPKVLARFVAGWNALQRLLAQPTYDQPIETTADVMAWVDSPMNANVRLCAAHHVAHQRTDTRDVNGHQAVGVHNIPMPIWAYQATCDWARWDMWAGTTGTVAVAPHPDGGATVLHVDASHPKAASLRAAMREGRPISARHAVVAAARRAA